MISLIREPMVSKDKSEVGMINDKMRYNAFMNGVSYFFPLYFSPSPGEI